MTPGRYTTLVDATIALDLITTDSDRDNTSSTAACRAALASALSRRCSLSYKMPSEEALVSKDAPIAAVIATSAVVSMPVTLGGWTDRTQAATGGVVIGTPGTLNVPEPTEAEAEVLARSGSARWQTESCWCACSAVTGTTTSESS